MAEYIDEKLQTVEVKRVINEETGEEKVFESKDYYISKFPAILGREIMLKYSTTLAKISTEYAENEEIMRKILKFVRVEMPDGRKIALDTDTLINNHVPDGEMLQALESAVLAYNFSFFRDGEL
jgi:hypothetical protein